MKLFKVLALTAIGTVALGARSQAATVLFEDNFNSNPVGLNATPSGWKTVSGAVDIIGNSSNGSSFDLLPGNGAYIDMDGSKFQEGTIRTLTSFDFVPGVTYTLTYDLAGNQRIASGRNSVDRVRAFFREVGGSVVAATSLVTSLAYNTGFTTITETFTVAAPVTARLFFAAVSRRSDNIGLLLDNVKLTAVPLPGAALLMLSGLAGLGAFARRRRLPVAGGPAAA
jgi:hypothetical protein